MESFIVISKLKKTLITKEYNKIQKNNIKKVIEFIFGSQNKLDKEDIEEYIFQTKKEIKILYNKLLSDKKRNFDFFCSIVEKIQREIKVVSNSSFKESLSLMSYYYFSLENTYREIVFEYESELRIDIEYPIEAYEYKTNNDSRPLKSNAYYALFHLT